MLLDGMKAQRHLALFTGKLVAMLSTLSDTADTIKGWFKVQVMGTSLEFVFTGRDIAKQMPLEANKWSQINKVWPKLPGGEAAKVPTLPLHLGSYVAQDPRPRQ